MNTAELLALLPLARGARVVVTGLDVESTITHGRVRSIDAEGIATVTLLAGCGDVSVPIDAVHRVCDRCDDCRTLSYRPRCARGLRSE